MKHPERLALALAFAVIVGGVGIAHSQHHGMHGQKGPMMKGEPKADDKTQKGHDGHGSAAKDSDSASTKAFKAANDKMHTGMAIEFSGDADVDFVKGMIPHHQGAVEMARIVLEHGRDPELKKLAQAIIKAQDEEIAFMTKWLEGKKK